MKAWALEYQITLTPAGRVVCSGHEKRKSGVSAESEGPVEAEKRRGDWKYMCIRKDVAARLDKARKRMEREIGFKLSWTKFFSMVSDRIEGLKEKAV